jgi:hypothetical protein
MGEGGRAGARAGRLRGKEPCRGSRARRRWAGCLARADLLLILVLLLLLLLVAPLLLLLFPLLLLLLLLLQGEL